MNNRPPSDSWLTPERFEELVEQALDAIPDALWAAIDNVAVTIEAWPSRRQLHEMNVHSGATLLGLYEGVPLRVRSGGYGLVPPDRITIFRGPIIRHCPYGDEDAVREQVRRTVLHEVAHHFGISDARLTELGAY